MKAKCQVLIVLCGFMALSAMAEDASKPAAVSSSPPDKEKVSYARGMRLAQITRQRGAEVDLNGFVQGLKDVLEGQPSRIPEPEMTAVLRLAEADQRAKPAGSEAVPSGPSDKGKLSYAVGNRAGLHLKTTEAELVPDAVAQGFKDVMEGKPTKVQESEMAPLFERAKAFETSRQLHKNKAEGDAFLAKNAKAPGITVLPDGLQYRVLRPGTGAVPTTNDLLFIQFRGSLLDGREFARHSHFLTRPTGEPKGWHDALLRMNVGAKWQIFVPPHLAFGQAGDPIQKVGPGATVMYELELLRIAQPGDPDIGTGRLGHGLDGESTLPNTDQ